MDKTLEEIFHIKKEIRILIIIFVLIFVIGVTGFMLIKHVGFNEALLLTLETLAFSHTEEQGLSRMLQLFLLTIGVILIWFIIWTTFDLVLEGHFKKYYFGVKNMDKINKLKDHYIICGAGRVGENIAKLLKANKKSFVLLEKSSEVARDMEKKGYLTLQGASVEEETLLKAGIKKAKFLIACTGDDAKNILIILTARELNPDVEIAARANEESMVKKLRRAGAKHIFLPELLGAKEVINELGIYK
ncbi:MAG: NAD(P)-binding protein [Nanoarchaeota archaeon]